MRKLFLCILCLTLLWAAPGALGASLPEDITLPERAALDAASAVVSMHDAMMRDYFGTEYSFASLVGIDSLYALFGDGTGRCFLMVSFDEETGKRADIAVLQAYAPEDFRQCTVTSLQSLYLPICLNEERAAFNTWLNDSVQAVLDAAEKGEDYDLDYYYGEFAACGFSVFNDIQGQQLFTAVVDWYEPMSVNDITALME